MQVYFAMPKFKYGPNEASWNNANANNEGLLFSVNKDFS